MKQLFYTLLICLGIVIPATAQQNKNKVPSEIVQNFTEKYPDVKPGKWESITYNRWQVSFRQDNKRKIARFNQSGEWMEEEYTISAKDLPPAVQTAIDRQHTGDVLKNAAKINSALHNIYYKLTFQEKKKIITNLYTPSGELFTILM